MNPGSENGGFQFEFERLSTIVPFRFPVVKLRAESDSTKVFAPTEKLTRANCCPTKPVKVELKFIEILMLLELENIEPQFDVRA